MKALRRANSTPSRRMTSSTTPERRLGQLPWCPADTKVSHILSCNRAGSVRPVYVIRASAEGGMTYEPEINRHYISRHEVWRYLTTRGFACGIARWRNRRWRDT